MEAIAERNLKSVGQFLGANCRCLGSANAGHFSEANDLLLLLLSSSEHQHPTAMEPMTNIKTTLVDQRSEDRRQSVYGQHALFRKREQENWAGL